MSSIKATFTGTIVVDPELKTTSTGRQFLEFPVYVNHARRNRETGNWITTGDVSKIRVTLWNDRADSDFRKGDLVEVTGTLVEKEFSKRDGSQGRSLQTDYIENIVLKFRKKDGGVPALEIGGFDEDAPF